LIAVSERGVIHEVAREHEGEGGADQRDGGEEPEEGVGHIGIIGFGQRGITGWVWERRE
jgi:hypothetical protein